MQVSASLIGELNQPLTALLTNAQAGVSALEGSPPDLATVRDVLDDIAGLARHMADTVREVCGLLRMDLPPMASLDMGTLTSNAAQFVRVLRQRGVVLAMEVPSAPVFVVGDGIQMQHVVIAILLQALQAMDHVPLASRRLHVCVRAVEDACRITVEGANQDQRPVSAIFSRMVVDAHGGSLDSEPIAGGSVRFTLSLPLARKPLD